MLYPRSQLSLKDRNFHERSREEEKVGKSTYLLGAWWSEAEKDVRAKGGMESRDSSIHFTTQGEGRRHQDFLPISDICTLSLLQDVKMWNMWNLSQISHSDYFPKPHPPSTHNVLWALTTMDYHQFPMCHALTRNRAFVCDEFACVPFAPLCAWQTPAHLLQTDRKVIFSVKPSQSPSPQLLQVPPAVFHIHNSHLTCGTYDILSSLLSPLDCVTSGCSIRVCRWWGEWR